MSNQTNSQNLNKVTVSCWNVDGLNSPVKRMRILCHLAKLQSEIALLQETHLTQAEAAKLKQKWVGQVYHSGFNSKSRGVAILVHKKHLLFLKVPLQTPKADTLLLMVYFIMSQ